MAVVAQFLAFGPFFSSGALVTAPKLYHYTAGTLTLKDVWTTRTKSATAAQPVVGDANGVVSCFADGLYKFIVKDSAGNTLYTWDNVSVTPGGILYGEGSSIVSAATLTLGTDGDTFHVTGSSGPMTAISGDQNQTTLIFDSTPVLTHSANLILQNSINYTAVAGDVFMFLNEGAGVWREQARRPANSNLIFPATQVASSNANTLDDYEEGTWTPSVGGSATYTSRNGFYTKIGRECFFTMNMTINAIGTGSTYQITGLPIANGAGVVACSISITGAAVGIVWAEAQLDSTPTISCYHRVAAAANVSSGGLFGNATNVAISGHYAT